MVNATTSCFVSKGNLWHKRFGHMGLKESESKVSLQENQAFVAAKSSQREENNYTDTLIQPQMCDFSNFFF